MVKVCLKKIYDNCGAFIKWSNDWNIFIRLFYFLELYDVCELLQGEFGSLRAGLTSRSIEAKASDYLVTDLSSGEASTYRDVLCKTIYGRLFTWLINRINETIKV